MILSWHVRLLILEDRKDKHQYHKDIIVVAVDEEAADNIMLVSRHRNSQFRSR